MFVILLKFSENKSKAVEYMDGHNEWIKLGFEDGVFLLVGSLQPDSGGSVIAPNASLSELEERAFKSSRCRLGTVTYPSQSARIAEAYIC